MVSNAQFANFTFSELQRSRGTRLPDAVISSRIQNLVEALGGGTQSNIDSKSFADNVIGYIRENEFVYTLQPPLLLSENPVDEFLFDSRRGFCEHYASSFVTLMRAAGFPARLVVGYLGGELNPRANLITVRQEDAHAWAEIWHENNGWIRVDPTAAIAPDRIENGINFNQSLANDGEVRYQLQDLGFLGNLIRESQWYGQLARKQWNRWFVGFDHTRQQALLRNLGIDHFSLDRITAVAFVVAVAILIAIWWILLQRTRPKPDAATRLYAKYCRKLAGRGLVRLPHEGPMDYYLRCANELSAHRSQMLNITNIYLALRYGGNVNDDDLKRRRQEIRALNI